MPLFGPPNIEKIQAKSDTRRLIKALDYKKDSAIPERAAAALGEIGDLTAVDPLIDKLWDKTQPVSVHQTILCALGKIGDRRAARPVIAILKDPRKRELHEAAALALGEIGDARAINALIDALGQSHEVQHAAASLSQIGTPALDPLFVALKNNDATLGGERTRIAIIGVLDNLGWKPEDDENSAWYWAAARDWERCVEIGIPAIPALIGALHNESAADALKRIGSPVIEPLISFLLEDTSPRCRYAAQVLGEIGDKRAVEPLILSLQKKNNESVRQSIIALGLLGDTRAVEPLVDVIMNGLPTFQKPAIAALAEIGSPRASELLIINGLVQGGRRTRQSALKALLELGVTDVRPLLEALNCKSKDGRRDVARVLDEIGWEPDLDEQGALYWIAKKEFNKCVKIGQPAIEPLIAYLDTSGYRLSDIGSEDAAIRALGRIGDTHAFKPLVDEMFTKDREDHYKACRAALIKILDKNDDSSTIEPLLDYLRAKAGSKSYLEIVPKRFDHIGDPIDPKPIFDEWAERIRMGGEMAFPMNALVRIGSRDPTAIEKLLAPTFPERPVHNLFEVMKRIGEPAVESLVRVLENRKSYERETYGFALHALALSSHAADILGEIGDPGAASALIDALTSSSDSVRRSSAFALVKLYKSRHVDDSVKRMILAQKDSINTYLTDFGKPKLD